MRGGLPTSDLLDCRTSCKTVFFVIFLILFLMTQLKALLPNERLAAKGESGERAGGGQIEFWGGGAKS